MNKLLPHLITVLIITVCSLISSTASAEALPETFFHDITHDNETVTIKFSKFSNRGPIFKVLQKGGKGYSRSLDPGEVRTYIGRVPAYPGAVAAAIRRADGSILARLTFESGVEWIDVSGRVSRIGTETLLPQLPTVELTKTAGSDLYAADVLIDLPKDQVIASGGTAMSALEMAEYSMMCVNTIFMRDAAIINRIGRVIIRMDADKDPYLGLNDIFALMNVIKVQARWYLKTTKPAFDHDLALVASAKIVGGGASLSSVGSKFGYSANGSDPNGDFSSEARVELYQNWLDFLDDENRSSEGSTIGSGNFLGKMSAPEIRTVLAGRNRVDSRHLDNLGKSAPALPPRAADDIFFIEAGNVRSTLNVLRNDNDTNGSSINLKSVSESKFGISPRIEGRAIKVTSPKDFTFKGDYFSYDIEDADGQSSTANVHFKQYMSGDVLGHWTFDQNGQTAYDSSSRKGTGKLVGGALIKDGRLVLDGVDGYMELPGLLSLTNTVTYSAMVYLDNTKFGYHPIFVSQDRSLMSLSLDPNHDVTYHWGSNPSKSFTTGLKVPRRQWTLVAMVVEPNQITTYVKTGKRMQMKTVAKRSSVRKHSAGYTVGKNSSLYGYYWKGMMDEVQIIDRALTSAEISELDVGGSAARDPSPVNGAKLVETGNVRFSWTPSEFSIEERLFVSKNYMSVRDAIAGDPSDQGVSTETFVDMPTASKGRYYWRVDSIEKDGTIVKGNIWTFDVSPPGLVAHWPLAELEGKITEEVINDRNGTIVGTPVLAKGVDGKGCYDFDKFGWKYVGVPYDIDLNPETFTISLWARVDVSSGFWSTAVSSRDESTPMGFGIFATSGNAWSFRLGNGTKFIGVNSPNTIVEGKWYHLTGTYDGRVAKLYVDGKLEKTVVGNFLPNRKSPLTIANVPSGDLPFNGCISGVRIWDKSINAKQINKLYRKVKRK